MNSFNQFIEQVLDYKLLESESVKISLGNVLLLLVIFLITRILLGTVRLIIRRRIKLKYLDKGSVNSIMQLLSYFAYIIAIGIALESIGIKMSFLLASSAALLVGLGLGLQQVFYDVISGVILLFEGTIQVDDVVQINNLVGKVKQIGLRTSKIYTREGTYIIVPNSKFISGDVINWSHLTTATRFQVEVGVGYESDVSQVKECLLNVANGHDLVVNDPPPFVRFADFGENALQFELFFWTEETFGVENIKSAMRFEINQMFREKGINIPYPQRDIHIINGKEIKR